MKDIKELGKELFGCVKKLISAKEENIESEELQAKFKSLKDEFGLAVDKYVENTENEIRNLTITANQLKREMGNSQSKLERLMEQSLIQVSTDFIINSGRIRAENVSLVIDGKETNQVYVKKDIIDKIDSNKKIPSNLQYIEYFKKAYNSKKIEYNELRHNPNVYEYLYVKDRRLEDIVGEKGWRRRHIEAKYDKELNKLSSKYEEIRKYLETEEYLNDNKFAIDAIDELFSKTDNLTNDIITKNAEITKLDNEILQKNNDMKKVKFFRSECNAYAGTFAMENIKKICDEWEK